MTVFIVLTVLASLWVASLYVRPFHACPRCHGKGVIISGPKASPCQRCNGARRQQRFGSRTVHRTVRMIRAERARTRQQKESSS